jgi:NADH-quinone oxidoreductase subunit J
VTRNPVTSAMFLLLAIFSMAGLFVLLHAYFLAAVQILVYAGAVMVLFVFVIMLLDLKEEERRRIKLAMAGLGVVAAGVIALVMIRTLRQSRVGFSLEHTLADGSTLALGRRLFENFALPFELVSLLLLVAMIGTVLLSKKDLR